MSHAVYKVSSIARPLEPKYPSNLIVLILLPVIAAGIAALEIFVRNSSLTPAIWTGVGAMVTAFISWALGREIDPDRNAAAFVAMALAVAAVGLDWSPAVWSLAMTLMATRVVNRSVGPAARLTDLAIVALLAWMAVLRDGHWALGAVAALAMVLDLRLDKTRTLNFAFAGAALAATVYAMIQRDGDFGRLVMEPIASLDSGWTIAAALIGGVYALIILTFPPVTSVADATGEPLSRTRVKLGAIILLLAAAATLLDGQAGLLAGLPLWAVIIGGLEARAMPKRK